MLLASCKPHTDGAKPGADDGDDKKVYSKENYVVAEGARNYAEKDSAEVPADLAGTVKIDLTAGTIKGFDTNTDDVTVEFKKKMFNINTRKDTKDPVTGEENSDGFKKNFGIEISGTSNNAGIYIKAGKKCDIVITLKDVDLTSNNTPCINIDSESKVYLVTEGTAKLTDGRTYGLPYGKDTENGGKKTKGTIASGGKILMTGTGSLTISEGYKHGIYSDDYIHIFSGTYKINSTGRNGIQTVNAFIMDDGKLTINGTGTNTNNESRGIVVEGSETRPGEGAVIINGGTIEIETVGKGITAKWDIEEDVTTPEETDDPFPRVEINGGTVTVTTTGTPNEEPAKDFTDADGASVTEEIKLSAKGIEGRQAVTITGGTVTVTSVDDCIKASRKSDTCGGWIEITGGTVKAASSEKDALDAEGDIIITSENVTLSPKL